MSFKTKYNELRKIKNCLIILNHQCILNEIYGSKYSGRFKGLPVFFFKKDKKRIFENNLTSLWSGIPGKIFPSRLIVLIYFRMQHQSYNIWTEGINILISVFFLSNLMSNSFCKTSICSSHLSGYHVIRNHVVCWDWYLSSKQL